jgi:hypothetical protein
LVFVQKIFVLTANKQLQHPQLLTNMHGLRYMFGVGTSRKMVTEAPKLDRKH